MIESLNGFRKKKPYVPPSRSYIDTVGLQLLIDPSSGPTGFGIKLLDLSGRNVEITGYEPLQMCSAAVVDDGPALNVKSFDTTGSFGGQPITLPWQALPNVLGDEDFTIQYWAKEKINGFNSSHVYIKEDQNNFFNVNYPKYFPALSLSSNGVTNTSPDLSPLVNSNIWILYTITKKDNVFRYFQNGNLLYTTPVIPPSAQIEKHWYIGSDGGGGYLQGRIAEFTVYNICKYIESFTLP